MVENWRSSEKNKEAKVTKRTGGNSGKPCAPSFISSRFQAKRRKEWEEKLLSLPSVAEAASRVQTEEAGVRARVSCLLSAPLLAGTGVRRSNAGHYSHPFFVIEPVRRV